MDFGDCQTNVYSYKVLKSPIEFNVASKFIDTVRKFHGYSCFGKQAAENRDLAFKACRRVLPSLIKKYFPDTITTAQPFGPSANVNEFAIVLALDVTDYFFYLPAHEYLYGPMIFIAVSEAILNVLMSCKNPAPTLPKDITFFNEINNYQTFVQQKGGRETNMYTVVFDRAVWYMKHRFFNPITSQSKDKLDQCVLDFFTFNAFTNPEGVAQAAWKVSGKTYPCALEERVEAMKPQMAFNVFDSIDNEYRDRLENITELTKKKRDALMTLYSTSIKRQGKKVLDPDTNCLKYSMDSILNVMKKDSRRKTEFKNALQRIIKRFNAGKPVVHDIGSTTFCIPDEEEEPQEEVITFPPGPLQLLELMRAPEKRPAAGLHRLTTREEIDHRDQIWRCSSQLIRYIVNSRLVSEQKNLKINAGVDFLDINEDVQGIIFDMVSSFMIWNMDYYLFSTVLAVAALQAHARYNGWEYKANSTQINDIKAYRLQKIKTGIKIEEPDLLDQATDYFETYLIKRHDEKMALEMAKHGGGEEDEEARQAENEKKMLMLFYNHELVLDGEAEGIENLLTHAKEEVVASAQTQFEESELDALKIEILERLMGLDSKKNGKVGAQLAEGKDENVMNEFFEAFINKVKFDRYNSFLQSEIEKNMDRLGEGYWADIAMRTEKALKDMKTMINTGTVTSSSSSAGSMLNLLS